MLLVGTMKWFESLGLMQIPKASQYNMIRGALVLLK